MSVRPFHLALPAQDLEKARRFYTEVFECEAGREDPSWLDLNFYGHQLVFHKSDGPIHGLTNPVDQKSVPVPHFGVILKLEDWRRLVKRLKTFDLEFVIEPYERFDGGPGKQATFFIRDPNGLVLEFKAFRDDQEIFARKQF